MLGDGDTKTFRPDDGITRAEGAIVLIRIFGEKYDDIQEITTKYSDIDQTYMAAKQAITKATELGILSGYPDGTFRPNNKMTRAEFMKVIASYINKSVDEEGLQLDFDSMISVYDYNETKDEWAVPYVTLLYRLNMTESVKKQDGLRIGEEITRAEVAQLCNFFLFRAPAKVTLLTETNFSDVVKTHTLIADIIEATREEHRYSVAENGREIIINK
jgi:hypothetical protein